MLILARAYSEDRPADVPPEIVAKMTEYLKKANQDQRKNLDARMSGEIAEVTKATGLDPEGGRTLAAAAGKAEDAAQADLAARCLEEFAKQYVKNKAQVMAEFNAFASSAGLASSEDLGSMLGVSYTGALDQPAWKEALTGTLTPEQAAAWEKIRSERDDAARKEINRCLDNQIGQFRELLETATHARSNEIIVGLDLPKDRADQITALVKKAVDASLEAWRRGATKTLLNESEATRSRIIKSQGFYFPTKPEDAPEKQPVWISGLAQLLTDGERARLQAAQAAHRTRRVRAVGQLMLAVLDEKIAFTASQRQRLAPVAERLVQLEPVFFPDTSNQEYYAWEPQTFYAADAAVRPEEVRPVLDDIQWKHWQEISHLPPTRSDYDDETPPAATPTPASNDASPAGEPEDLEQGVSDNLQGRAAAHQKENTDTMVLQAEDATRIASLAEPNAARLQTAARGAAEASTASWMTSVEQNIRSQMRGATIENIHQKLAAFGRYYFGRSDPPEPAVWKEAVKAEMTAPQQAAWQAERDERSRYNDAAVTQFLLAEFDRKVSLTPEQWDKLTPLITKAIQEYRTDIASMFAYGRPWYLTSYYVFLPIHGVPENDLKALLTHEQWSVWTGSSEYSTSISNWDSIRQNHANRTEAKKR